MKKESLPLALFTSFLVMVVGAVIWGILYYYGIFSSWVAFISTACAGLVYCCFYKKRTTIFYFWIIVMSLVLNLLSVFFTLTVFVQINNQVSVAEAFNLFGEIFAEVEFKRAFLRDVLLCAGFTFIGGIFLLLFYKLYPKSKKKVEEVEEVEVKVQPKIEEYAQDEQKPRLTKEEQETKTVADYYVKEMAKIVSLKDNKNVQQKMSQFETKYISKMTKQMKERVLNYLLNQKYSGNELKAAKVLIIKLKG